MPEDSAAASPDPVPLMTVSVQLPTYWMDSPEAWFLQTEAQFDLINALLILWTKC